MTNTVWKYKLRSNDTQVINMPKGATIFSLIVVDNVPCLYAMVDEDGEKEERVFEVYGTGNPFAPDADTTKSYNFLGSYKLSEGFVGHVFEVLQLDIDQIDEEIENAEFDEEGDAKDFLIELLKNELLDVHEFLDELDLPSEDEVGAFSTVGRIHQLELRLLQENANLEASLFLANRKDESRLDYLVAKYTSYVGNLEWHLNVNKPTGREYDELIVRISDFKEVLKNLKSLKFTE